jgi:hypothetical protein
MTSIARRVIRAIPLVVPLIVGAASLSSGDTKPHFMLGVYPGGALQDPTMMARQKAIDTWIAPTGQRLTIAGDFMAFEFTNPQFNVPAELNAAWNNGYIPFVNFTSDRTSTDIANGAIDADVRAYAHEFARWSNGGQKRVFVGLLPEANGFWTVYHTGGSMAFIAAYRRIRNIFEDELAKAGVPSTAISWVFVPQGATNPPEDAFELWYPGGDVVDIVAFSGYNYGGCPPSEPWLRWEPFDIALLPYLDRMRIMAPHKPVFISQIGTLDKPVNGIGDKDAWLDEAYTKLSAYPGVRGAVYFNYEFQNRPDFPNCPDVDFRVYNPATGQWQGFKTALGRPNTNFGYYAPGSADLINIVFARPQQTFSDIEPVPPLLAGENLVDWAPWVDAIYAAGITTGCSTNPLRYCPDAGVTRAQMAVFLMRAIRGSRYTPPPVTATRFADVPGSHPFAAWIEAFAGTGITGGCATNPLQYCPDDVVTRAQMAVFLLRALHGSAYSPPSAMGIFSDVPAGSPFASWVEALAASGITGGCATNPLQYCPDSSVTRAQMAVFLVRAFHL